MTAWQATATTQACQQVGMPECRINLAHLVSYLAEAPKSTRAYEAYARAEAAAKQDMAVPVPMPMRNAPTGLMKDMGYGEGYCYNPEYAYVFMLVVLWPLTIKRRYADTPSRTITSPSASAT